MGAVEGSFSIRSVSIAEDSEDLHYVSGERKLDGSEVEFCEHLLDWDV